jgi:hypothetical protein
MAREVPELKQEGRSAAFSIGFQHLDELLCGLPDAKAVVTGWIPILVKLFAT